MKFFKSTTLCGFLFLFSTHLVEAATCKQYASCRQAVINWCAGNHPRADGDRDGIPCEKVCRSRAQVKAIMKEIGCSR